MVTLKDIVPNITKDFSVQSEKFNSLLELGENYFLGKEYDKAISVYEKAIEESPKNGGGWMGKALSHLATSDVIGINEVDVKAYLDSAIKYADSKVIEKYLIVITLYYAYNYAAAIKLLIDQTNQAIAEKKAAEVRGVVGLATAVIGGAIANNSKSSFGSFVGYGMLAGGTGVTVKSGYDSFRLDQLSKSLYGNALAQTIISVPVIMQCHNLMKVAQGDLRQNTNVILDSWKDSVIYLFKNEKEQFIKDLKKLEDVDNLVKDDTREVLERKVDEILYFMDIVGLDESKDYKSVMSIKNSMSSFKEKFNASDRFDIMQKKKKIFNGCYVWFMVIVVFIAFFGEVVRGDIPLLIILIITVWRGIKFYRDTKKLNKEVGLDIVENEINEIMTEIKAIQIEKSQFDLDKLGL